MLTAGYHINYFKQTKHPCSFLLFVVLYETKYGQHNHDLYYRPSTVDPFTGSRNFNVSIKQNNMFTR